MRKPTVDADGQLLHVGQLVTLLEWREGERASFNPHMVAMIGKRLRITELSNGGDLVWLEEPGYSTRVFWARHIRASTGGLLGLAQRYRQQVPVG